MNYAEVLGAIASLAPRGWRLGLDRMQELVRRSGLEDATGEPSGPQFIHVAGTNGKGSVTACLQSMLVESGYRTGAFYSPYVYNPRERIQFGRDYISEEEFADIATILWPIGESLSDTEFGGVTEFEFKAAMGFLYWKILRCQWVALEVGLGGRLDATNVVTPRASVIVSIGLDHTSVLGGTVEEIAYEKAGVIKPGVPAVVGSVPVEALAVIERVADEQGAPLWRWGKEIVVAQDERPSEFIVQTPEGQHCGLRQGIAGAMQGHNLAVAVAAMDAAGATRTLKGLVAGGRKAALPGRLQVLRRDGKTIILDGAHNADAARVLAESLAGYLWTRKGKDVKAAVKVILVTGMVEGHDPAEFYRALLDGRDPREVRAHAVPIAFRRGLSAASVGQALSDAGVDAVEHDSVSSGIQAALTEARADDVVLVTGSFYLLGEAGRELGIG